MESIFKPEILQKHKGDDLRKNFHFFTFSGDAAAPLAPPEYATDVLGFMDSESEPKSDWTQNPGPNGPETHCIFGLWIRSPRY